MYTRMPQSSACPPASVLQSPSTTVRAAAVRYIAAAASQLSAAETYAQLLPLLRPQLAEEPLSLEVRALSAHLLCIQPSKRGAAWPLMGAHATLLFAGLHNDICVYEHP